MTTTLLEARYRTVLRLLPAYYRRAREEEMVETYLWDVDRDTQDQSRPTLGEVASVAALALRTRFATPGAPRPYALFGTAARQFALFAVLLQAATAVVEGILELTWASTHGRAQWEMFTSGFTGHGLRSGIVEAALWTLPLLWTAGYFALLHDRRRLARVSVLLAAVPTLWPLLEPLLDASVPPEPAYATATALLAWLSALAVCAAHHRDAPPASLPAGSPGLLFTACCVVMGGSVVLLPEAADSVWAPATGFLAGSLGWLLWRTLRADRDTGQGAEQGADPSAGQSTACGAVALAVLGLLILVVRVAALEPWLDVPVPAVFLGSALGQGAALALLTAILALVGRRGRLARRVSGGR
ncbi:hypothetical protein [Streptomyces sp. TRM68367]|uniref:hypothetical protein n=1 Tax=Streptomyces sp. TRM68367 TaxID=2758415 RepID=UPI00165A363E|nr:hypothetical protein [Streptomyces sp. TRM68367]MBC9729339.1 hypothetical protein [Streptomyces sp. TRM68367]